MKKILVTNIGNRNITYKGDVYSELYKREKVEKLTFREWSKVLLDNFESEKDNLKISILDVLLEERKEEISKIYIFYSDHPKDKKHDQDTLYEAEIIKKLLQRDFGYHEKQIELKKVTVIVIDNEKLLRYYRNSLRAMKKYNDNPFFLICDAGGTPQQKSSLKIIAEFLLDEDKYEVQYVSFGGELSLVPQTEYRKIINQEQAIRLIHLGEYTAAAEMLDYIGVELFHQQRDKTRKIFAHIYFRFICNERLRDANLVGLNMDLSILNYHNNASITNNIEINKYFNNNDLLRIVNHCYKAIFYFGIKSYSYSILSFAQFYEALFNKYIEKTFDRKDYGTLNSQNESQKYNFINWVKKECKTEINVCNKRYNSFRIDMKNLATQCIVMKKSEVSSLSNMAKRISPFILRTDDAINSNGGHITSLRNKIAHEGRYITESEIKNGFSYYPSLLNEIKNILKLKFENLFLELNNILEQKLRN